MPSNNNDGRGQVKDPENDGRLKENQGGSGRGGSSSSKSSGGSGGSGGSSGSRGGGSR